MNEPAPYLPAQAEQDILLLDSLSSLAPLNRDGHSRAVEAANRLLADLRDRVARESVKKASGL